MKSKNFIQNPARYENFMDKNINLPLTSTISPGTRSVAGTMDKQPISKHKDIMNYKLMMGNKLK